MLLTSRMVVLRVLLAAVFIIYVASTPIFPGHKPGTLEAWEQSELASVGLEFSGMDQGFYLDSCNRASVTPLDDIQKLQIREAMTNKTFLNILERFKNGESDAVITSVMQTPVVTFTPQQKRQILQSCHGLFAKTPNEKIQRHSQRTRRTNSNDDGIIVQRDSDVRVCPPVQSYNAMVIALDENYDPVQIVQVRLTARSLSICY